jgi:uncharacterized membrane protein (DUF4010 family)
MDGLALLHRLGVALAIGLLVGAERHWRERGDADGQRTAGVRTFGITGLTGGVIGALALALPGGQGVAAALLVGLGLLGHSAAMVLFKLREAAAEGEFSVTSVVAAQATFLLGALAVLGDVQAAGAAAVAVTALLAAREQLHGFVARLSWMELRSAVLLLAMTLVVLPLVPDRPLAALGGLNPSRVWLMAVTLAGIGYLGYIAMRLFGASAGQLLAGLAAGLVSSTAAAVANGRAALERPAQSGILAAGALVAGAVSYLRTAAIAWVGAPGVGGMLVPALVAGAVAQGLVALALLLRGGAAPAGEQPTAENPFELASVLRLALLLAVVALVAEFAAATLGGAAVLLVAAFSGLADVDAVTLTMPALVPNRMSAALAATAIAVAVASNTLAKCAYAAGFGSGGYATRYAVGALAGLAATGGVLLSLW